MRLRECLLQAAGKFKTKCNYNDRGQQRGSKMILDIVNSSACRHDKDKWELVKTATQELRVEKVGDPNTYYNVF